MGAKELTTGQAARICSVTPDTILKWIRSGRLTARRTPGGHHRIDPVDLDSLMHPISAEAPQDEELGSEPGEKRPFSFCWEFHSKGKLLNGCRHCAVFKMRALRCYQVAAMQPNMGHNAVFCQKSSCEECEYFKVVHGQAVNVLVVTDDAPLVARLEKESVDTPFNLRVADCEYNCSALVDSYRPDFAVIDCAIGKQRSRDICDHLIADPRIPFVRVILAASQDEMPTKCNKDVFAQLDKPFGIDDIDECIVMSGGDVWR